MSMKVISGSFLPRRILNTQYVMEDAKFFLHNVAIVGSIVRMLIQCPSTSYELLCTGGYSILHSFTP